MFGGLGVAILFTTPVLIVILVVSVLGLAIGVAAIAAYGTLLLVGPVIALFGLLDFVLLRTAPRVRRSPLQRRLVFIGAVFALALLGWVPYVGTPLLWLISVLGLGAASWQIYENIRAQSRRDEAAEAASASH